MNKAKLMGNGGEEFWDNESESEELIGDEEEDTLIEVFEDIYELAIYRTDFFKDNIPYVTTE